MSVGRLKRKVEKEKIVVKVIRFWVIFAFYVCFSVIIAIVFLELFL